MNRRTASLIFAALWALIYLPGLGSTEIKGEEGRRILPAVTMLQTGNWLVPYVGGKPFLRKPPLVNWVIAGSFQLFDARNEWTARLPSALAVLGLGLGMIAVSRKREESLWTIEAAFVAALMVATQSGLLAKARFAGAEIEGIYVPVTGLAIVWWLAWWMRRCSPWILWIGPMILLGIAALTKGPSLHLLFFYAVVIAVLWRSREWSLLWHPAHFVGLMIGALVFGLWAIPYFRSPDAAAAAAVWKHQGVDRFTQSEIDGKSMLLNFPRALADQLPWLLFAPVLWRRRKEWSGREGALVQGTLWAVLVCFLGLIFLPGVLTRYVLPLGVPFAAILAVALTDEKLAPASTALRLWWRSNNGVACGLLALAVVSPVCVVVGESVHIRQTGEQLSDQSKLLTWPLVTAAGASAISAVVFLRRRHFARPVRIAGASGALIGAGMLLYAGAAVPFINRADNLRPMAREIDRAARGARSFVVYDPDYQPVLFYLRTPFEYAAILEEIPKSADFVLTREEKREKLARERPEFVVEHEWGQGKKDRLLLLHRRGGI